MRPGDGTRLASLGRSDGPSHQQTDAVIRVLMARYGGGKDDADQSVTIAAALGIDLDEMQACWATRKDTP